MSAPPLRSSTPDAEMRRGSAEGMVSDWVSSCYFPTGAKSAPSSVTKGMAMRNRAMELSPAMLSQRLSLADRDDPGSAAAFQAGTWGKSQAFENKWTFWVDSWEKQGGEQAVQDLYDVGMVQTIKEFWALFDQLRVSEIAAGTAVHLFRTGVRPTWEDERNLNGGHFRSVVADGGGGRVWLKVAMAAVGEQLEGADRVCGVSVANKEYGTTVSIWIDSRDPALRDMIANQFANLTGDETQPAFRPHRSMLQQHVSPRPQRGGARSTPRREAGQVITPQRLKSRVFDAQAALSGRQARSAPTSPCVHGLTPTVDMWPSAMSTTAFRRIQFGMSPRTEQIPAHAIPVAMPPIAQLPTDPSPLTELPKQQSKRALRAGVTCLNPAMVGAHTTGQAPTASKPASAARRSHSDTDSQLTVPRQPISARVGGSTPRRSPRGFPRIPGMPSPPAGLDAEKTPVAWADAPWNPAELSAPNISPQREHAPEERAKTKVQMRPVPEPDDGDPSHPQDPHNEWQLHQRARDIHQRTSPPPSERRGSGQGSGQGQQGKGAAGARASAASSGKSMSLGFVHKGYLFPAGLNRKQRRTIIFNGDRMRRGEVPEGIWVGEEVPDGPVTDEELATLKAGGRIDRRVPLAALGDESAPVSRGSPNNQLEEADQELLALSSPVQPPEHNSDHIERSPSPPHGGPPEQPPLPPGDGDGYSYPHHSPELGPMPGGVYDPYEHPPMGPGGEGPLRLRELNPDAAAFVPGGMDGPGPGPPPAMMNGVPMMRRMGAGPPPGMGPGAGPERVIIVRQGGHTGGPGGQLLMPGDGYPPPGPPGQRIVTVQRPATQIVRTAPGYGGGVVTHVRRVVSGPMPGGIPPGARLVQTGGPPPGPMGMGGATYVSAPPGPYGPGPPPPGGPQVVRYVYHQQ